MKKIFVTLLMMALVLTSFAACGNSEDENLTDEGPATSQTDENAQDQEDQDDQEDQEDQDDQDEENDQEENDQKDQEKEDGDKEDGNNDSSKPSGSTGSNSGSGSSSGNSDSNVSGSNAGSGSSSGSGSGSSSSKPPKKDDGDKDKDKDDDKDKDKAAAPKGTPAEIIDMIYEKKSVDLSLITNEVDLDNAEVAGSITGLSSMDKVKEAAYSESMMGAQAYSLVVVRVKDSKDAASVADSMLNGIDPRKWVCVEADDVRVAAKDDVVVLFMVDSQYADTVTGKEIISAFKSICGGSLDVNKKL